MKEGFFYIFGVFITLESGDCKHSNLHLILWYLLNENNNLLFFVFFLKKFFCRRCKDGVKKNKMEAGHRVAYRTKSELEVIDDGFKWRKYGKKSVKNSPNPR